MNDKDDGIRPQLRRFFAKFRAQKDQEQATAEALNDLESEGLIDHDESEMMQGILYLDKTEVQDIQVPRTEIAYVDLNDDLREIIRTIINSGHSRLPVVEGDLDNVLGFIHVKDLLAYWDKPDEFSLERVLRRIMIVPETKKIDALLREFQERHEQFALVLDEFGGTSGLITIEDILEEVFGEIEDEYDRQEPRILNQNENSVTVSGRFEIEKVGEILAQEVPEGDYITVGGWIVDRIGRMPQDKEKFTLDGFDVEVVAASDKLIRKVCISKPVSDQ
ncbi:MAG TPA: hemolysin family protein [bacterium]|nr:hemolysin family protein [bacterium]